MAVKEPVQDQEALLKALKLMATISTAADTHKNVLFSGEKGREKYKNTDFTNADSILENAVEGSDIAENLGMKPGGVPAYTSGLLLDLLSPTGMAVSAASKGTGAVSKLAKFLTPLETATEEAGKKVVKKSLPKYFKQAMSDVRDFPKAERMAEEAIETGVSKNLSKPEKALEALRGKKSYDKVGGSKELPIHEYSKTDGTMDAVGDRLRSTVERESKGAGKVSKGRIFREEMSKVLDANDKGIEYRKNESALEKILRDAISPTEKRTVRVTEGVDIPPPVPAAAKETPPSIDDLGLDDMLSRIDRARVKPAKTEAPKTFNVQYEVDKNATLAELWDKKLALRAEFKKATLGKPMSEWTEKDKVLEGVIDNLDERIANGMSKLGKDEYAGLNQKFSTQAKIEDILESQLQAKQGSGVGNVVRSSTEVATGGGGPAAAGRGAKNIVDAISGPKRRVQFGNMLQDRKVTTPWWEGVSEATEIPFDPAYLEDSTERTEDADVDLSEVPEVAPTEVPAEEDMSDVDFSSVPEVAPKGSAVEEIPDAGPATDIMAPGPDMGGVEQKMSETLMPVKPQWDPYFNEEVLNTFLPRDSERLLQNKTALLAKMHQVAPNQVAIFKEMMDNDPEGLKEMAPKIAGMYPAVFEKDQYGAFDGKIVDPQMQQKFLFDLAEDESMNSIEKARLAMKVQRGQSINS